MGTVEPGREKSRTTQERIASAVKFHMDRIEQCLREDVNAVHVHEIELAVKHLDEVKALLQSLSILKHYSK